MSPTKILITGATGYIGGSVLTTLLNSTNTQIKDAQYTALVRKQEAADELKKHGVDSIFFKSLDDVDIVRKAASEADIVINTASAFHGASAEAVILGLADRKKATGKETYLIHTSGTSSLGDRPVSSTYIESRTFSDKDDIYTYLRQREDSEPYGQRTTDLVVFEKGVDVGIKTYILMSPTIYGIGSGFFNKNSIQIDALLRAAKREGFTSVVGTGAAHWDHVHIEDLVELYEIILSKVLAGEDIPSNKQGLYFNETGDHSWREISERIAKEGVALGYLKSDEVKELTLEEASKKIGPKPEVVELGFASRSATRANLSRELGWKPKHGQQSWEESFKLEWEDIAKETVEKLPPF